MQKNRLNLSALRHHCLPRHPKSDLPLSEILASGEPVPVSRRELLGMAGVAAVAMQPAGKSIKDGFLGSFEFDGSSKRAVFKLGGRERWVIDPARFAGSPKLECEREPNRVRIALTGALYPGTNLPADFACELRPALVGWRMTIKLKLGRVKAEVPFERWLAGQEPARGRGEIQLTACKLGDKGELKLSGATEVEFRPDWRLALSGSELARLTGIGRPLTSDEVTVSLPGADEASIIDPPPKRRTLVSMERGSYAWVIPGAVRSGKGDRLEVVRDPFDHLYVETGQDSRGRFVQGAVVEGNGDEPRLAYCPGNDLTGPDGGDLRIPLRNPRYAVAFDKGGEQTALVARYGEEPVWVHTAEYSVQVGDGAHVEPFEVVSFPGEGPQIRCEPALVSFAAPLAGAIVEPVAPAEKSSVGFITDGAQLAQVQRRPTRRPTVIIRPKDDEKDKAKDQPAPTTTPTPAATTATPRQPVATGAQPTRPGSPAITVSPRRPVLRPGLSVGEVALDGFVLPVIRPRDMLALRLQFKNLTLETGDGREPRLVRRVAAKPAYITVHFPPQNVAEQAFLEGASEYPNIDGADDSEPLADPPVRARLAGDSRLVFELPSSVTEVPYRLEELLDWSKYEPSVAATALPPPDPPARVLQRPTTVIELPSLTGRGLDATMQPRMSPRPGVPVSRPTPRAATAPGGTGGAGLTGRFASDALIVPGRVLSVAGDLGRAVARVPSTPEEPSDLQTAIEAPYRLILSPNTSAGWVHSLNEVTHGDSTELWHTRLGVRAPNGKIYDRQYVYDRVDNLVRVVAVSARGNTNDYFRTLRAVWSPDYTPQSPPTHNNQPFRMSLDGRDRYELVDLTSNFRISNARSRTIDANRFMLSSLGAWMDVRYGAEVPLGQGLSVEEWKHQATMGRDQYVKVVYKGYLFPFGHRASLVKVTERKFVRKGQLYVAYLRQRYFIVVREPEKTYPVFGEPNEARKMPFRKCTITTLVTPNLAQPEGILNGQSAQAAFWPKVGGRNFPFHVLAEDWDGTVAEFTAPMIFVGAENSVAFNFNTASAVAAEYNKASNNSERQRDMFGQKIALAESSSDKPGDTAFEAESVTFMAEVQPASISASALEQQNLPRGYPLLKQATITIAAVVEMTGKREAVPVSIHESYDRNGWSQAANKGQVFLELLEKTGLEFPKDKSGGLMTPDMMVSGISRQFGAFGGRVEDFAGGVFNPEEFFKDMQAKILGGIDLAKILQGIFGEGKVPKFTVRPIYPNNNNLQLPEAVETKMEWDPDVKEFGPFKPHSNCKLNLTGVLRTELTGTATTTYEITVALTKFKVDVSFIIVDFDKFKLVTKSGKKPDVDVDVKDVAFGGPLEFINTLRDSLKSGSGLGGFSLDINFKGITAGYSLAIPDVAIGVMSLQNMSLAAAITLPFTGDPVKLRFAFNTKQNPCLLTVSMFGGGMFFALEVSPRGMELMEAAFEFGGNFSLNIGVASGGAYLMAGIYFKLQRNDDTDTMDVRLSGYLRCGGHLEILRIITISAEFYLELTYEIVGGKSRVWGQASLKVSIKILFFSVSVTLKVEREFAGSGGGQAQSLDGVRLAGLLDGPGALAQLRRGSGGSSAGPAEAPPKFADLMSPNDWRTYCEAFA